MNISETCGPIATKFYLKHHWGGGKALGFGLAFLMFKVPVNNFSVMFRQSRRFLGITSTFGGKYVLHKDQIGSELVSIATDSSHRVIMGKML